MNKKNEIGKLLDDFNSENGQNKGKSQKRVIERTGLIERVDKILVTKEGKQLLREQY